VLLHLGRPLDVAERGLVFIQSFLQLLAEREACGALRPWFKEVRAARGSRRWGGGIGGEGSADRQRPRARVVPGACPPHIHVCPLVRPPLCTNPQARPSTPPPSAQCWAFSASTSLAQAVTAYALRRHLLPPDWDMADLLPAPGGPRGGRGGASLRRRAAAAAAAAAGAPAPAGGGHGSEGGAHGEGSGHAGGGGGGAEVPESWDLELEVNESELPPLDPRLLSGGATTPAAVGAAGPGGGGGVGFGPAAGELGPGREASERLFHCLVGHLYNLARGELLRMGSAAGLAGGPGGGGAAARIGRAAFSSGGGGGGGGAVGGSGGGKGQGGGWDVLVEAAARGGLSPVWMGHLQVRRGVSGRGTRGCALWLRM
jgi:hypothetical protein